MEGEIKSGHILQGEPGLVAHRKNRSDFRAKLNFARAQRKAKLGWRWNYA